MAGFLFLRQGGRWLVDAGRADPPAFVLIAFQDSYRLK